MYKKIAIGFGIIGLISLIFLVFQNEVTLNESLEMSEPNVIMPTKSSRPGCEIKDLCYIPSEISIIVGESVIWQNQDAAFHSVTSGTYEKPDGLFDSGHLDPNQYFKLNFEDIGEFDYYCTLHPWMKGKIIVGT